MNSTGKKALLLGVGLVAAIAAAAQSFVIANQRRAPARSVALGMPPVGAAKASLSRQLQGVRLARKPKSVPSALEVRLAREAFAGDPLAVSALPVLIQSLQGQGNAVQSRQLLTLASQLTRRDNLINAMLIDDAMAKDNPERAVKLLGQAMTVSYEVRDLYVGRMAAATVSPGALQALPPILGRNPKWAEDYWLAVLANPAAIPQAAEVRQRIAGAPWKLDKASESDFRLIVELAARGYPASAFNLAHALGLPQPPAGELLTNPGFDRQPRYVPIDWELLQTGDIGANIEAKEGALLLSSLPDASGIAARQIVHLTQPGGYRVQWNMSGLADRKDATVKLRLSCAERGKGGTQIAPATLAEGTGSARIEVPASNCSWYWATIELDTTAGDAGVDIAIRRLSLQRAAGAAPKVAAPVSQSTP